MLVRILSKVAYNSNRARITRDTVPRRRAMESSRSQHLSIRFFLNLKTSPFIFLTLLCLRVIDLRAPAIEGLHEQEHGLHLRTERI